MFFSSLVCSSRLRLLFNVNGTLGYAPFVLHHAGPSKGTIGRRCSLSYTLEFISWSDRWAMQDMDAGGVAARLKIESLGWLRQCIVARAVAAKTATTNLPNPPDVQAVLNLCNPDGDIIAPRPD